MNETKERKEVSENVKSKILAIRLKRGGVFATFSELAKAILNATHEISLLLKPDDSRDEQELISDILDKIVWSVFMELKGFGIKDGNEQTEKKQFLLEALDAHGKDYLEYDFQFVERKEAKNEVDKIVDGLKAIKDVIV